MTSPPPLSIHEPFLDLPRKIVDSTQNHSFPPSIRMEGGSAADPRENPPSDPTVEDASPLVSRLRKLLFRRMIVGVKDGRFFMGSFHCIDKQGNILLQDAVEHRRIRRSPQSPMEQRCVGLILIPAACRSSCHVDCSIHEHVSLLSLDR